jgi:4,5-DOPA dioxygenase extradiol
MVINAISPEFELAFPESGETMPVVFAGHGSPMNAIEDNEYSRAWEALGKALPKPKAILCISAHWETPGTLLTAMDRPRTIHDFGGFPRQLYEIEYPAPGSPALCSLVQSLVTRNSVNLDLRWGLDHGTWSVLRRMFPQADIPVVQLSLDRTQAPEFHYALGNELAALRKRGVLVIGSGNIVHNLGMAVYEEGAYDWAVEFDQTVKQLILAGNHAPLIHYSELGRAARLSIPTNEHYLPLLYVLATQEQGEEVRWFNERVTMGSVSMRGLRIG